MYHNEGDAVEREPGEVSPPPPHKRTRTSRSRSRSRSPDRNGGGRQLAAHEPRYAGGRGGSYERRGAPPGHHGGGGYRGGGRDRGGDSYVPTGAYHFKNLAAVRGAFVDTYTKLYELHDAAVRGKPVAASALSDAMTVAGRMLACPACYEIVNTLSDEVYVAGCAHAFHKNGRCWQPGAACPACAATASGGGGADRRTS
jgi:hypothetical protein